MAKSKETVLSLVVNLMQKPPNLGKLFLPFTWLKLLGNSKVVSKLGHFDAHEWWS